MRGPAPFLALFENSLLVPLPTADRYELWSQRRGERGTEETEEEESMEVYTRVDTCILLYHLPPMLTPLLICLLNILLSLKSQQTRRWEGGKRKKIIVYNK